MSKGMSVKQMMDKATAQKSVKNIGKKTFEMGESKSSLTGGRSENIMGDV